MTWTFDADAAATSAELHLQFRAAASTWARLNRVSARRGMKSKRMNTATSRCPPLRSPRPRHKRVSIFHPSTLTLSSRGRPP